MAYGSEAWLLNSETKRCLRGANAFMLSHITGKTKREEARPETTSFDLVMWIRARRLKWAGHILRLDDKRLIKQTLRHIYSNPQEGDLLMDLPAHHDWNALQNFAEDRDKWRARVRSLKEKSRRCTKKTKTRKKKKK